MPNLCMTTGLNKLIRGFMVTAGSVFLSFGVCAFVSCASADAEVEEVVDYSSERSVRYEMAQIASLHVSDCTQALVRARNLRDNIAAAFDGASDSRYPEELYEEVEALYNDSLGVVEAKFFSAVEDADWGDAMRLYRSLAVFDVSPDGWTEQRVAENQIKAWVDDGNTTLADLVSVSSSTPEDEAPSRGVISSMIPAVVTVWVDRGLAIQRGVGYANIVIGSGFFIDRRGYIVTNYHVISSEVDADYEGYSRLYIKLADDPDTRVPARVVGWDPVFDLALLKTEITPPAVFQLGSSKDLRLGARIYAIGSPAGLDQTLTSGIVSAQGRRLLSLGDVLQIDAPINHGNSGGPIIDEGGRVQAVVFAGIESYEGLNFAIPVELLKLILPQLYSGGRVAHSWLGAYGKTATPSAPTQEAGVSAVYCVPGLSLFQAGVPENAVITAVNGMSVKTLEELQYRLMAEYPGTIVRLSGYVPETAAGGSGVAPDSGGASGGGAKDWYAVLYVRPEKPGAVVIERDLQSRAFLPMFGMNLQRIGSTRRYSVASLIRGGIADESGFSQNDVVEIRDFLADVKNGVLYTQLYAKRRKSGYMESYIGLGASLDSPSYF